MSMAVSFLPATPPPLFHHLDPELHDALLGFVYDPAAHAFLDLSPALPDGDDDSKRPRSGADDDGAWLDFVAPADGQPWRSKSNCGGGGHHQVPATLPEFPTDFVLPLPPQMPSPAFVRGADAKSAQANGRGQSAPSAAARERRRRISEKTAELSRLVPGGNRLNTAEMLQEAGRHVKLLQAQVGVLALMRAVEQEKTIVVPSMAQDQMQALLGHGSLQERLAAEGKCLVPRKLVDAMAKDEAVESNASLSRDLARFVESLPLQQ